MSDAKLALFLVFSFMESVDYRKWKLNQSSLSFWVISTQVLVPCSCCHAPQEAGRLAELPFLAYHVSLCCRLAVESYSCAFLLLPLPQPEKQNLEGEALAAEDSVRAVSISTLYLVSTTVDRMSDVSQAKAFAPD